MSASARGDDDPLAGATIVVHDLSRANGSAPAAGVHGRSTSPASVGAIDPPSTSGMPAPPSDRWWPIRFGLVAIAFTIFGAFGYATWLGRPPTPITFGALGAQPKVEIRVHVDGAVTQPGVYKLAQGDRVEDAITAAGGLAAHADHTKLNMAQRVRDEQRLDVPSLAAISTSADGDTSAPFPPVQAQPSSSGAGQPSPASITTSQNTSAVRPASTPRPQPTARATAFAGGKVNVNTATQAQLEQLPGFGATSAQRIISYRTANGPLRSLDDVRKAGVQNQFVRQAADYLAFE